MKKIPIYLLAFMLIFTLCLTASADETYYGTWELPETLDRGSIIISVPNWDTDVFIDGVRYVKIYADINSSKFFVRLTDESGNVVTVYNKGWTDEKYRVWTVNSYSENTLFEQILLADATRFCDGSMCSATDLNMDNICDDCGGILTYNLRSDLYAYAVNVVARGQELFNADYWLITTDAGESDGYRIFVSTHPFSYDRTTEILTSAGTVQYVRVYTDTNGTNAGGTGWASKSAGTALDYGSPVEVSHDISGFFPVPLWVTVEGAAQREIPNLTQTTAGTILTLTLCGVGLMALLVVFVLFGKVFRTYRS